MHAVGAVVRHVVVVAGVAHACSRHSGLPFVRALLPIAYTSMLPARRARHARVVVAHAK
jgi:hypothetical protein